MAFCGYKFSLCLMLISMWGIAQLLIMGILFYSEAPAFIEDIPMDGDYKDASDLMGIVKRGFKGNAYNCFIAACLYIVTMGLSGWQFYLNQKTTYQV